MKVLFILVLFSFALNLHAQYPIGHRSIDFTDPTRTRTISCEVYYPGTTAGDDVACATGSFPVIIFGHGFSMGVDAYTNFTDSLAPLGYVIVLPTTEGGLSPDHAEFGLDLKFLNDEIQTQAGSNSSFFLYNHFNGKTAIAGHSMGGGASFLAAASNSNVDALINFAAAETDPSAIAAAASVTAPVLMFQGENDGVTPPVDHQIPMYNALTNSCRYKVTILGGGHCYFANYNLACSTGEFFTSPQPTISREEQHDAQFDMLIPFLEWHLMGNASMKAVFEDSISQSDRVSAVFQCPSVSIDEVNIPMQIWPNPANDVLFFHAGQNNTMEIRIVDLSGREMLRQSFNGENISINTANLPSGYYFVEAKGISDSGPVKLLIIH